MPSKTTVLAVDDEPLNLEILAEMLGEEYRIITVESGEACLQQLAHSPPDIILLDINMPGLNGMEVCARIKADPNTRHIPVLYISALSRPEEIEQGLRSGAEGYITKPFYEDELIDKLETALG
ncbi:response regulator [Ectothiorhodospiraceae bacterium BW-2]|nr:response regulator [Ectothiorhodospiraceae bacterium BW-2]